MKCRKVRKLLDDYLDHLLPEREREEWEAHLKGCPACREIYRSARKLRELLSPGKRAAVPSGYWKSFWPRLRSRLPERRPRAFPFPVWRPAYAAALGSAVILVLAFYTGTVMRDRGEVSGLAAGMGCLFQTACPRQNNNSRRTTCR